MYVDLWRILCIYNIHACMNITMYAHLTAITTYTYYTYFTMYYNTHRFVCMPQCIYTIFTLYLILTMLYIRVYTIHLCRYGQFRGGDSYVVQYTYKKNKIDNYIIYFWLGNESSADEKGTAALKTKVCSAWHILLGCIPV